MKIRFIRGWREIYQDGQIVDFAEGLAVELIRRGICEVVLETETRSAEPPDPAARSAQSGRRDTRATGHGRRSA